MLALGLAAQANMKEASYLANLAAGIVVGKIGTATVSQKELVEVL
jgi:D-beta-D-heptose 7-phosphate kinase/D-beta-D-heptose 1-phosphate adenosyltransferase